MGVTELGRAIDAALVRRGIRQRAAALELGVSQQTLSKWRTGVHFPDAAYYPVLARFLDLTPEQIAKMRPNDAVETRRANTRRIVELEERVTQMAMRQAVLAERLEKLAERAEQLEQRGAGRRRRPAG